ncbi:hypothetical protein ACFSSC_02075 [Corynebacterium mendelii]|uniref:AMIN-like domain-containing protein n=1 Tax=Corynebacterium mendelii TaxID=2765362 RepID=A0A939E086_9CORY|nr:hypothetical protein [Corynebacterium mendelii]MBN9644070.1 hypothetical protein [Corynebacterium mendelii]
MSYLLSSSRLIPVAAMLGAVGLLAGCAAGGGSSTATTVTVVSPVVSPVATTVTVDNTTAPGGLMPLGNADKEEKTRRQNEPADLMVDNIRVGDHPTFERVVFDLTGYGKPSWFITYTDAPSYPGSGHPVQITGDSFLDVNIDGIAFTLRDDMVPQDFSTRQLPDSIITEIADTGIFEGRHSFVIGITGDRRPYSVDLLDNPTRLVIDVLKR